MLLIAILLIPAVALAKNYDAYKVYSRQIDTTDVIFKAGDQLTASNGRISVEVYYLDALGTVIDEGKGSIKSVTIDGEKVTEWVMTERYGSVIQIGNMIYQAALGFNLKPAYTAADSEGYLNIIDKTYKVYEDGAKDKKVKFTGNAVHIENGFVYVSIAENMIVAVKTDNPINVDDRTTCKGTISEYSDYQGTTIPVVTPDEFTVVTSISARIDVNDLYLRNQNGSVITATKKGDTVEVLGYDPSSGMFNVEVGGISGYIKGTGLNISRDELLKYFK